MNPFTFRPAYRALDKLPAAERWARLRDPEVRARILAEPPSEAELTRQGQFIRFVATRWDRMFVMGDAARLRADRRQERRRDRRAHQPHAGRDRLRLPDRGRGQFPVLPGGRLCPRRPRADPRVAARPGTLLGLGDGGAHCGQIVDAGLPSYMLSHWGRDRRRGPGMPLEQLVKMQTSETADFFGFHDRGRLAPGLRADVNLIDFDRAAPAPAGDRARPAGRRPPPRAARRRLPRDAGRRHRRSSSTARTPAPAPAGWCAPGGSVACSPTAARPTDIPALRALMDAAIGELQAGF